MDICKLDIRAALARKAAPVIDAEQANEALVIVGRLHSRQART
jgi:hypothetical protein